MRELEALEDLFRNLMASGSDDDFQSVLEELQDLELYASKLVHVDLDGEVGLDEDLTYD